MTIAELFVNARIQEWSGSRSARVMLPLWAPESDGDAAAGLPGSCLV